MKSPRAHGARNAPQDGAKIEALTLQSYRHFALKRMLLQMPPVAEKRQKPKRLA